MNRRSGDARSSNATAPYYHSPQYQPNLNGQIQQKQLSSAMQQESSLSLRSQDRRTSYIERLGRTLHGENVAMQPDYINSSPRYKDNNLVSNVKEVLRQGVPLKDVVHLTETLLGESESDTSSDHMNINSSTHSLHSQIPKRPAVNHDAHNVNGNYISMEVEGDQINQLNENLPINVENSNLRPRKLNSSNANTPSSSSMPVPGAASNSRRRASYIYQNYQNIHVNHQPIHYSDDNKSNGNGIVYNNNFKHNGQVQFNNYSQSTTQNTQPHLNNGNFTHQNQNIVNSGLIQNNNSFGRRDRRFSFDDHRHVGETSFITDHANGKFQNNYLPNTNQQSIPLGRQPTSSFIPNHSLMIPGCDRISDINMEEQIRQQYQTTNDRNNISSFPQNGNNFDASTGLGRSTQFEDSEHASIKRHLSFLQNENIQGPYPNFDGSSLHSDDKRMHMDNDQMNQYGRDVKKTRI